MQSIENTGEMLVMRFESVPSNATISDALLEEDFTEVHMLVIELGVQPRKGEMRRVRKHTIRKLRHRVRYADLRVQVRVLPAKTKTELQAISQCDDVERRVHFELAEELRTTHLTDSPTLVTQLTLDDPDSDGLPHRSFNYYRVDEPCQGAEGAFALHCGGLPASPAHLLNLIPHHVPMEPGRRLELNFSGAHIDASWFQGIYYVVALKALEHHKLWIVDGASCVVWPRAKPSAAFISFEFEPAPPSQPPSPPPSPKPSTSANYNTKEMHLNIRLIFGVDAEHALLPVRHLKYSVVDAAPHCVEGEGCLHVNGKPHSADNMFNMLWDADVREDAPFQLFFHNCRMNYDTASCFFGVLATKANSLGLWPVDNATCVVWSTRWPIEMLLTVNFERAPRVVDQGQPHVQVESPGGEWIAVEDYAQRMACMYDADDEFDT